MNPELERAKAKLRQQQREQYEYDVIKQNEARARQQQYLEQKRYEQSIGAKALRAKQAIFSNTARLKSSLPQRKKPMSYAPSQNIQTSFVPTREYGYGGQLLGFQNNDPLGFNSSLYRGMTKTRRRIV